MHFSCFKLLPMNRPDPKRHLQMGRDAFIRTMDAAAHVDRHLRSVYTYPSLVNNRRNLPAAVKCGETEEYCVYQTKCVCVGWMISFCAECQARRVLSVWIWRAQNSRSTFSQTESAAVGRVATGRWIVLCHVQLVKVRDFIGVHTDKEDTVLPLFLWLDSQEGYYIQHLVIIMASSLRQVTYCIM